MLDSVRFPYVRGILNPVGGTLNVVNRRGEHQAPGWRILTELVNGNPKMMKIREGKNRTGGVSADEPDSERPAIVPTHRRIADAVDPT
jgi:hypothetical protein